MYRFSEFTNLDKAFKPHYMVIGHPIGHTLSPVMHNLALRHHGIDARYYAIDLAPADVSSMITWMRRPAFRGTNITIPYKREFLDVVDQLDETASAVGAVNTLVKHDTSLIGYNTDVDGFRRPLETCRDRLEGARAIVFGSGGASLAVLYALRQLGMEEIVVVSRNPGVLTAEGIIPCNYSNWQGYAEDAILLVNATPLGMAPRTDTSPTEGVDSGLLEDKICYDLVYNPLETLFLKSAKKAGATVIDGLEMFIGQGDRSFELWTGHRFPRKEVRHLLIEQLTE